MNKDIPLYYNEDKTKFGVLVSYGFGAGWSTWSGRELAYDRRVIEFWLAHQNDRRWMREVERYRPESPEHKEACEFFINELGLDDCPYMGGFPDCVLQWVPVGARFRIDEYDGAESLEVENEGSWW